MRRVFHPLLFICLFPFCSCESGGTTDNGDHELPVISISYPNQNANMAPGDTVTFNATITDNDKLQNVYASLTGPNNELYWDISPVVSNLSTYHLNTSWIVNGVNNPPVTGLFYVTASDMNNNIQVATKTVNLTP